MNCPRVLLRRGICSRFQGGWGKFVTFELMRYPSRYAAWRAVCAMRGQVPPVKSWGRSSWCFVTIPSRPPRYKALVDVINCWLLCCQKDADLVVEGSGKIDLSLARAAIDQSGQSDVGNVVEIVSPYYQIPCPRCRRETGPA